MKVIDKTISQITLPTPFAVGDVHVYILEGELLSLIDAGVKTKEAWEAFQIQLKEIGYGPNDIEQIILTHHHPDHIGLIEQFPRVQHIIAHHQVNRWITRDTAYFKHYRQFFKQYFTLSGVPEDLLAGLELQESTLAFIGEGELTNTIDDGDILPGHQEWTVIETKGHAQSHLSFLRQQDQILLGGDHLLKHISSNPLMEPQEVGQTIDQRPKPMLQYRRNLDKCMELGIENVLPGHGRVVRHPISLIQERLKKHEERAEKVYHLLDNGEKTPYQLCMELFPKQFQSQIDLTMSVTFGQLDYLEDQARIYKTVKDGHLVYAKTVNW
ncbi:hypothetical protein M948_13465 [Virgibacillus sp. CM-4]|uniref:MBL fold metallo-hydrolase n=1 Tax=Virgibacillus TaxID=84406 RepID=UPI0003884F0E|nr:MULTISPECIES: MBL fold metallo-hydrolase [Virgibacillus]EQB36039.1 hypothetical protein M948_13465 [Virgibacillus sp. CM-4]